MKKRYYKWSIAITLLMGIFLVVYEFLLENIAFAVVKHFRSNTSIGVIGGADGPTAIYLASNYNNTAPILGIVLILVSVILFFCYRYTDSKTE